MEKGKNCLKFEVNRLYFCFRHGYKSAKGIAKYAKRELTHNKNKETLTYCSLVRSENVRIISCNHNLQTIITNKIYLSAFYNKRYIHAERVTTSPFGHKRLREDMFIREIGRTIDWGEYDVDDAVVPTPTDNGSGEDLAEAIEAQAVITWIFLLHQIWGSTNPHTLIKTKNRIW